MPTSIVFTKLQALGNDFVLIDSCRFKVRISTNQIRAWADRKRGLGFDQLLLLKSCAKKNIDAEVIFYNADGSRAEMCGNGLRAAALYLWRHVYKNKSTFTLKTDSGIRNVRLIGTLSQGTIECEMGVPEVLPTPKSLKRGILLGRKRLTPLCINVGNPHAVVFAPHKYLKKLGPFLETHKAFPKRTNVELVEIKNRHEISVHVWERGVGVTDACGTGAIASSCAAILKGKVKSPVKVIFPGGTVSVRWAGPGHPAFLKGHAREVYSGRISRAFHHFKYKPRSDKGINCAVKRSNFL